MKPFAVFDADNASVLVRLERIDLLPRLFGQVYMPDAIKKELLDPMMYDLQRVQEFAQNPPDWVIPKNPTTIDPTVLRAQIDRKLHAGEAAAISLAKELAQDGSPGVVLSNEGGVRKFLNTREGQAQLRPGTDWSNWALDLKDQKTRDAPGNQRIFSANTWSVLCQAADRGLIHDFDSELARAKTILTPSDKVQARLELFASYWKEQRQQQSLAQSPDRDHEHDRDHGHER